MNSIHSFAAYVPRYRLRRAAIAEANGWFAAMPAALTRGARTTANWDEDAVTMAVAASRLVLGGEEGPDAVWLASTTAPFADRLNAGIVASALDLPEDGLAASDLGGSGKAGSSALLDAFERKGRTLVAAAERPLLRAGSRDELVSGDGAAAFVVGPGPGLAALVASARSTVDFVDHYRGTGARFDYWWEERWARDEGYRKLIPHTVRTALDRAGIAADDVDHAILPLPIPGAAARVAKDIGLCPEALADDLQGRVGHCGAAHGLLMLAGVLEAAEAGRTILLVGFGQGVDAAILRTNDAVTGHRPADSLQAQLSRGLESDGYMRFLAHRGLIEMERGLRAELDLQTQPTILYRNRRMLHGFVGGRCTACGAPQFPRAAICVNPACGAMDTQEDHRFADSFGRLQSYTADRLTYSPDPPARYGMVMFDEGGCLMMDITDARPEEIEAGASVRMAFRIKRQDERRGIRSYFWKAVPAVQRSEAQE
ncbi:MAG: 3-hydroxy-3-methylglutaryl CoA synthase [Rhodobacteraceae bacterium HLUCCA24]|nr:MAG: 3-hydroxy-3-methylglutaryl CoA synthase [Rhodobacteraceae bacterium HLUCCA24]